MDKQHKRYFTDWKSSISNFHEIHDVFAFNRAEYFKWLATVMNIPHDRYLKDIHTCGSFHDVVDAMVWVGEDGNSKREDEEELVDDVLGLVSRGDASSESVSGGVGLRRSCLMIAFGASCSASR